MCRLVFSQGSQEMLKRCKCLPFQLVCVLWSGRLCVCVSLHARAYAKAIHKYFELPILCRRSSHLEHGSVGQEDDSFGEKPVE